MADKIFHSTPITFIDRTDERKLDIYITSNLPTIQIRNSNTGAYSPNWNTTNLRLTSDVYLDSTKITPETIQWYTRIGTTETLVNSTSSLTISTNVLSSNPIITYICKVKYQNIEAFKEITFTRVDTGRDGTDGADGTSVNILGSYNTLTELQTAHPTGNAGDAYIIGGNLYVWAVDDAEWDNVGNIQGPAGKDGENAKSIVLIGDSQVFKVNKNNAITPATIKVTAYAFNTTATNWTYSTNGGQTFLSTAPTGVSRNGNIVTITGSTITSNSIVIKASDGEVEDVFTIYKAIDGSDGSKGNDGAPAPIAFLTNENVTFSANAQGQIATTTITSNIVAYNGTTKVTPTIGTITGAPTGMTITPSTITASNEIMLTITIANNSTLGSVLNNMGVISIPVTYPVSTVLSLTWSKVNAGTPGATGPAGSDAYTVMLTNESHIFAGDVSNALAGSTTTQVIAYKGATTQPVTITSVNGKTASTIDTDTGITGLKFKCSALSGASPTITFTCTTAFTSASGSIPIVLSVGGISFTKMFTYSISFKGSTGAQGLQGSQGVPGTSASLVDITPSAYYFKSTTGKDGTFTPDFIYLYPRFQNATFSSWQYSRDGVNWYSVSNIGGLTVGTYNSTANTLRISRTSAVYTDTFTSVSFRCNSTTSSVYDIVSIAKIYDVVDLQIGGRNLVLASNTPVSSELYPVATYQMSEDWELGTTYTITIKGSVNSGQKFGIWANGSASRVATLNYDEAKGIHIATFTPTSITTQKPKVLNVYNTSSDTATAASIEWIKLEKGNKATDWSPAPEDLNNITFQIYAPNGYLLTNELQSISLQTFAYEGSLEITSGATFQWSQLVDDVWIDISGATNTTLTVTKTDVLKAKSYRCIMTYKGKSYTSTITVQDKTDAYNSIMCISSNAKGSECYWVLYTLVYSDTSEIDPLLGPISISAPTSPVNGDYWYAVDSVNATVQLKKYNGTTWANSTDKQSLTYLWNIVNDGSVKTPIGGASKVQVVSCHDFTATATLMCDVSNELDGILTQSSLSITDASDPIVSQTEPTSAVDGQIWIKPNTNGAYNMFVWSEAAQTWIASDMDTRNKVYTSKPSSYSKGDIWITESNTVHSKYLEGTLLQASQDSTVYNENDWSPTLKYDKDIAKINSTLYDLSQYVTITSSGLKIGAVNSDKELSPFTSLFTSTELAFYQNSDKLLTLANNQLTAPRIVVEEELEVNKKISLGDLQITIENNGSFSFAVTK